jgi:hypothetical protein
MNAEMIERGVALIGALIVGITAVIQLKNDWAAKGLDAIVTKLLLGLMALGCIFALLASLHIMGVHSS